MEDDLQIIDLKKMLEEPGEDSGDDEDAYDYFLMQKC